MLLRRKIELEREELNEIEAILFFTTFSEEAQAKITQWISTKLQEAFDFGFAEGKKEKEK